MRVIQHDAVEVLTHMLAPDSIAGQLNAKASSLSVKCPKDESADKGTTFTCTVTDGKDTRDVAITVTDDKGHVDWKLK